LVAKYAVIIACSVVVRQYMYYWPGWPALHLQWPTDCRDGDLPVLA